MKRHLAALSLALAGIFLVTFVIRGTSTSLASSPGAPRPCRAACVSSHVLSTVTVDATSTPGPMPVVPTPPFALPPAVLTPGAIPNIQAAINMKRELNHEPDAFGPNADQPVVLPTTVALQAVAPAAPPSPSPNECGAWAASDGAVGSIVTARFGEIRDCGLYGTQWLIAALGAHKGGAQQSGVIAIYQCATDTGCLDGQNPHTASGWQFFPPPYQGGVTVLERSSVDTDNVVIDNAGAQICFSLRTHTYDTVTTRC